MKPARTELIGAAAFRELSFEQGLDYLVALGHTIERTWSEESSRPTLIEELSSCLGAWRDALRPEARALAPLAAKLSLDSSLRHFLGVIVPLERANGRRGRRDDDFLVIEGDRAEATAEKAPLVFVLDNIRSAFNTGAMFRTAECLGAEKIYLCGYTATPDDAKTARTTMGTETDVAWEWAGRVEEVLERLRRAGTPIVAIETVAGSDSIFDARIPEPCAFVFGNERHGLSEATLRLCDRVLHIPVHGRKNSLNVGIALGICGFEARRQWRQREQPVG